MNPFHPPFNITESHSASSPVSQNPTPPAAPNRTRHTHATTACRVSEPPASSEPATPLRPDYHALDQIQPFPPMPLISLARRPKSPEPSAPAIGTCSAKVCGSPKLRAGGAMFRGVEAPKSGTLVRNVCCEENFPYPLDYCYRVVNIW